MGNIYYRVCHIRTKQGLWYDYDGKFTGLIHKDFAFCYNSDLNMPFNEDVQGWLSATATIKELYDWFPKRDILQLQTKGWYIAAFEANEIKPAKGHVLINQNSSKLIGFLEI